MQIVTTLHMLLIATSSNVSLMSTGIMAMQIVTTLRMPLIATSPNVSLMSIYVMRTVVTIYKAMTSIDIRLRLGDVLSSVI
jgi:hypothetical protein